MPDCPEAGPGSGVWSGDGGRVGLEGGDEAEAGCGVWDGDVDAGAGGDRLLGGAEGGEGAQPGSGFVDGELELEGGVEEGQALLTGEPSGEGEGQESQRAEPFPD